MQKIKKKYTPKKRHGEKHKNQTENSELGVSERASVCVCVCMRA